VKLAVIDVALVNVTELAAVTAPVEEIASTCGTDTKFVPAIVTLVAVFGIVLGVTPVIVGFVSPIVTEPPRDTADPFIVIAPLPTRRALATVPDATLLPFKAVRDAPEPDKVAPAVTVTVSPFSPIVIELPLRFLIAFTFISDIYPAVPITSLLATSGASAHAQYTY